MMILCTKSWFKLFPFRAYDSQWARQFERIMRPHSLYLLVVVFWFFLFRTACTMIVSMSMPKKMHQWTQEQKCKRKILEKVCLMNPQEISNANSSNNIKNPAKFFNGTTYMILHIFSFIYNKLKRSLFLIHKVFLNLGSRARPKKSQKQAQEGRLPKEEFLDR